MSPVKDCEWLLELESSTCACTFAAGELLIREHVSLLQVLKLASEGLIGQYARLFSFCQPFTI